MRVRGRACRGGKTVDSKGDEAKLWWAQGVVFPTADIGIDGSRDTRWLGFRTTYRTSSDSGSPSRQARIYSSSGISFLIIYRGTLACSCIDCYAVRVNDTTRLGTADMLVFPTTPQTHTRGNKAILVRHGKTTARDKAPLFGNVGGLYFTTPLAQVTKTRIFKPKKKFDMLMYEVKCKWSHDSLSKRDKKRSEDILGLYAREVQVGEQIYKHGISELLSEYFLEQDGEVQLRAVTFAPLSIWKLPCSRNFVAPKKDKQVKQARIVIQPCVLRRSFDEPNEPYIRISMLWVRGKFLD